MKIVVLSDIHGNIHALEAVLRHARGQSTGDVILNLGDTTGYGPNPEQTVQRIQNPAFINILGNYDKKVLSKKHRQEGWQRVKTPEKRQMFAWTYQSLSKPSRKFLSKLPKQRLVELGGQKILLTHGSPASINEHLLPQTPDSRLAELAATTDADIILCGHSHQGFIRKVNAVWFINPGTVGRPDDGDPRPSYAVLTLNKYEVTAEMFRVPYNINAAVHAMRQTGLPEVFAQMIRQGLNYDDLVAKFGNPPAASSLESNGILTLITESPRDDVGTGLVIGAVTNIAPQAQILDLTPIGTPDAARFLAEVTPNFPPGTVHLIVASDENQPIAARIGAQFYILPGIHTLSGVLEDADRTGKRVEIVAIDKSRYNLASAAGHLVNGLPLGKLGERLKLPSSANPIQN